MKGKIKELAPKSLSTKYKSDRNRRKGLMMKTIPAKKITDGKPT